MNIAQLQLLEREKAAAADGDPLNRTEVVTPKDVFAALIEWTPAALKQAEYEAECGSMKLAGDLCEFVLADDRVKSAMGNRTSALMSLPIIWDSDSPKLQVKALEKRGDWYRIAQDQEIKKILTWGIMLGVGLGEIVWERRQVKGQKFSREIPVIRAKNPKHLRFLHDEQQWQLKTNDGTWIDINPGDGRWILYTPESTERPWASGLWKSLAKLILLKSYAKHNWGHFSDRHGNATTVATYTEAMAKAKEPAAQFAGEMRALGRNGVAILPPGATLDLLEPKSQAHQTFPALIQVVDHASTICILGNNLTTDAASGTGNSASVHADGLWRLIASDDSTLTTLLHDQVLHFYSLYNFGDDSGSVWCSHDTDTSANKARIAATIQMISQGGATLISNNVISKNELRELLGLPPKTQLETQPNNDDKAQI